MKPTNYFRHVFRQISDGNWEHKVLALQQWFQSEGWEPNEVVKVGGRWEDIPFVTIEEGTPPLDLGG